MILIFMLIFISITIISFSLYTGISPMPSSRDAKKVIVKNLPTNALRIYELGSGWGGLALKISITHAKSKIYAFELSPFPWLISKIIGFLKGKKNLIVMRKNFFNISFAEADLLICYLYPGAMLKLKKKFEEELKPEAIVISNTFAIPGWNPYHKVVLKNLWKTEILFYRNPKSD